MTEKPVVKKTPNEDVKHLKRNPHTGTYSWDGGK